MPGSTRPRRSQPSRPSLGLKLLIASSAGRTSEVQTLLAQGAQGAPVNTQDREGFTSLMRAAQAGHLEIARLLLDAGADHSLKSPTGMLTALSFAVGHGHEEIVELLLRAGADPNIVGLSGVSLTWVVMIANQHRMLELLLDAGASLIGPMKDNMNNLAFAAHMNKPEAVKILLNHGAVPSEASEDGEHPLLVAASLGHTEIVRLLMGVVSLPLSEEAKREEAKALLVAAAEGHVNVVDCILEMGVPVDVHLPCDDEIMSIEVKQNETALLAATLEGHLAVVGRLIAAGADVNWSKCQLHGTPLWIAVTNGMAEVAKVLLNAGAREVALEENGVSFDFSSEGNSQGVTLTLYEGVDAGTGAEMTGNSLNNPLFIAAKEGKCTDVAALLASGADPNAPGLDDNTVPLMAAARHKENVENCLDVMHQLLDAGADINAVDDDKHSALGYACDVNNKAAVRFLLDHGAAVNEVHTEGQTVLVLSAMYGNAEVVKLLLDAGADAGVKYDGLTALQHAGRLGNRNVVEVLLAHQMARAALA